MDSHISPSVLLETELAKFKKGAKLSEAVDDADKLIDILVRARGEVAAANDPHTTTMTLTKLLNPVSAQLDAINNDIMRVHKSQNAFGKVLQNKAFAKMKGKLPTDDDTMESQTLLINRAVAMHFLREGQFGVASTFIEEAQPQNGPGAYQTEYLSPFQAPTPYDRDETPTRPNTPPDAMITDADIPADLTALQSRELQEKFADMYSILNSLKHHDLHPAITWARDNSAELEARGSNLEFELCKLQFIWLFKGAEFNGMPDTLDNGISGALKYGRDNFPHFQHRHLRDIQRLSCAMVYSSNLAESPYRTIFDITLAFDEVSSSFTREFCSLLGLSAESPLYVTATAGALALPYLVKYNSMVKEKNTEWTTKNELAFETPLPNSMLYHSIFVCPVSKEQTTDDNPPMILPCGHVLARDSLHKLAKGTRYKCPYCPSESQLKETREIIL
ncbi:CTLH/CRA C-terminal to lish motif domain-containing protein [Xylariaceae sp. FL1019]|nr:CTLH/CRA C-terminal to lish motif domain-containing protein [Xylariaceae sp. FL1019]